ncbi:MAG: glycerol kinase [Gammaproteobacteria bacterium]|nr:glycerol kinase [Gammaproteobacteria bacterium]MBP6050671.1 hypothetical protein [Pseudomonadales bacterium]MBK6585486.1 glycerol kinase [Gammaproteobacteria bacterium]MBK7168865.1 glycerol kinase [Gammaproteobacteria bacterium]MBK7521019.1 glycerol kinase [Gammaproteobacteria bacterium]
MSGTEQYLSGSALARRLNIPVRELFTLLAEHGWIVRNGEQWRLTRKGEFEGGRYQESERFGPYIAWPEQVLEHRLFSTNPGSTLLTAAALGARVRLSARQTNLLLLELGWIRKGVKGWELTARGKALGGVQEEYPDTGVPYVRWPATLPGNPVLNENLQMIHAYEHIGEVSEGDLFADPDREIRIEGGNGLRALDGHVLHSKAQLVICHWLYMSEIAHAHRRRLPVEGEYRCDFYLPSLHLYIEYWGDEAAPGQLAAKLEKKSVYERHGLRLLELVADDLQRLDDVLPRKLLKYGLAVY